MRKAARPHAIRKTLRPETKVSLGVHGLVLYIYTPSLALFCCYFYNCTCSMYWYSHSTVSSMVYTANYLYSTSLQWPCCYNFWAEKLVNSYMYTCFFLFSQ